MTRDPRIYLLQILEFAERILSYIEVGEDEFYSSDLVRDAVARNFELIGEVAKRLPANIREELDDVPWKSVCGFRDVLIHGYDFVDYAKVWSTATKDLPVLVTRLKAYLPPPDQIKLELDT